MEVKNEKKLMLKYMLPIEIKAIVTAGREGREYYCPIDKSWFDDGYHDISADIIYRTKPPKPETITPNELYDMAARAEVFGIAGVMGDLLDKYDFLNLVMRLEGFKDE